MTASQPRTGTPHPPAGTPIPLVCPECREPARAVPPRDWLLAGWKPRPRFSHHDGTPLCPVVGPDGSTPAEPTGAAPSTAAPDTGPAAARPADTGAPDPATGTDSTPTGNTSANGTDSARDDDTARCRTEGCPGDPNVSRFTPATGGAPPTPRRARARHRTPHPTTGRLTPAMSILDRLPPRPSCAAHLDADHAHVLLDALSIADRMIELGHRPWAAHGAPDPANPKTTEAGYLDLFGAAVTTLIAVVDAAPAPMLVRHTRDAAHACAALNLRAYPASADNGDRSSRIVVGLHGLTIGVQRHADHTAVDLGINEVSDEDTPVRVRLRAHTSADLDTPAPAGNGDTAEAGR
jgi:hypothetical protein